MKIEDLAVQLTEREACAACGLLADGGYRISGFGFNCSIVCAETAIFGGEHCRWCGAKMDKPYTGIDSRLCSEDCSANYYARVKGDRSARAGSAVRLSAWLQERTATKRHLTLEQRTKISRAQRAHRDALNPQNLLFQDSDNKGVTSE